MWAWILYVTQYIKWAAATADVLLNHYVFTRPENVLSLPHCWCCLANFMNIPLQRLQMYLDSWFVLEHLFDRRSFSFPSPVAHFTLCVGTYLIITSLSSSCDVPEHFDLYVTYHLHLQPNVLDSCHSSTPSVQYAPGAWTWVWALCFVDFMLYIFYHLKLILWWRCKWSLI